MVGTWNHQPPPQTQLGDWSRFVTTTEFLYSHLFASLAGGIFGLLGMIALALLLVDRGSVRLGLSALLTGVVAIPLVSSVFGTAIWAQPTVGRVYLGLPPFQNVGPGSTALASNLYYDATQPVSLIIVAVAGALLVTTTVVLLGVAVARSGWLPRWAGIGLVVAGPLFAVIGFVLDNWLQTVASGLMLACTMWIAVAARRAEPAIAAGPLTDVSAGG